MASYQGYGTSAALATLDPREATAQEIHERLSFVAASIDGLDDLDEINEVEILLAAFAVRLKQLGDESNVAELERVRLYRRLGQILGPAERGNPRPETGRGSMSQYQDIDPPLAKRERERRHAARTIDQHWQLVEPILPAMKRPTVNGVLREIKRLTAGAMPTPAFDGTKRYAVLYADPPWRYDFSLTDTRKVENQYPTMSLEEIAALDVPAADDAVLFMWVTNPKLGEAFAVLDGWGFEYVTNMVWVKDKIGMGYYARSRHELLFIAKRGEPRVPDPASRPDSVINAPRGEHSAKPLIVYDLIERMYPGFAKLELFARSGHEGWDAWGNEVGV